MIVAQTRYIMTIPTWADWYRGTMKKTTKSYKTEAEAKKAMADYANNNNQIVKEAPAEWWQIKKVVRKIEVDG